MTVTHRIQSQTATQRDAWVEVNLSSLEQNYHKIKNLVKTNIMAVVKADAYGHGAPAIAPVLESLGVHSFGVATVDEGIALRKAGIKVPVVILGATPFWVYESCLKNNLTITIYSFDQILHLEKFCKDAPLERLDKKIPVQLKIDTGMNRLGIDYEIAENVIKQLINSQYFELQGIFSHLSDAKDNEFSMLQNRRFQNIVGALYATPLQRHIANSFAAINYPELRYDLVRIGIALYGQEFKFLEPIISLKGRITHIRKVKKGEYVSYERTWTAEKESLIATVPIGYADGVDKRLSNKISGLYKKQKVKQAGNITMDQMMFDVTDIKDPKVNDIITLLSKELLISSWADILGTITYELVCRLKMRLPRVYTRE